MRGGNLGSKFSEFRNSCEGWLEHEKTGEKTKSMEPPNLLPKTSTCQLLLEIPPGKIPFRLKEDICRWKRQIDNHKKYFMEKGINPFREAHEILLSFLDNFDSLA